MTSTLEGRIDVDREHLNLEEGFAVESGSRVVLRADAMLAARGLRPRRVPILRTVSTQPDASPRQGFIELWRLPKPLAVRAAFATERGPRPVEGWFDHEVLTGDDRFDACVRVQTRDPDAMQELLSIEAIRRRVGLLVEHGGALRISSQVVLVEVLASDVGSAHDEGLGASVVLALLEHASD